MITPIKASTPDGTPMAIPMMSEVARPPEPLLDDIPPEVWRGVRGSRNLGLGK